ncbi:MAG: RNase adaptor protein RapZ, partial [Deltaproteobacteria bacterium]
EPEVQRWIFQHEVTRDFLAKLDDLLLFLLPLYEREGKAYLTIAIGCTGGMHRSVTIVNELGKRFSEAGYRIRIHHRDLYRASPGEKG